MLFFLLFVVGHLWPCVVCFPCVLFPRVLFLLSYSQLFGRVRGVVVLCGSLACVRVDRLFPTVLFLVALVLQYHSVLAGLLGVADAGFLGRVLRHLHILDGLFLVVYFSCFWRFLVL